MGGWHEPTEDPRGVCRSAYDSFAFWRRRRCICLWAKGRGVLVYHRLNVLGWTGCKLFACPGDAARSGVAVVAHGGGLFLGDDGRS